MKKAVVAMMVVVSGLIISPNIYKTVFAEDTQIEIKQEMTKEEALELLKQQFSNEYGYIYQGTEADFEALQKEGVAGYVYLPQIETDLGLFVNKETKEIYYFHPSGYLELYK